MGMTKTCSPWQWSTDRSSGSDTLWALMLTHGERGSEMNESVSSQSSQESPPFQRVKTVVTDTPSHVAPNGAPANGVVSNGSAPIVVAPLPSAGSTTRTSFTRRFAPDSIIAALVGLVITIVGLIAITRGGFNGSMRVPVVEVLGFTHTTVLGLIEVVVGACLLIAGSTGSRSSAIFVAAVMGIGAFVGAVQSKSFKSLLALESGMAWLAVIAAVVVVLSALLVPRFVKHSNVIQTR